jgi:hypothetical protein
MIMRGSKRAGSPSSRAAATRLKDVTGWAANPSACAASSIVAAVVPTSM